MTWTAEQQAAISREGSLIVSAAAGAGKTAVLTERIARLVAEGTPVDRLLVLTFTAPHPVLAVLTVLVWGAFAFGNVPGLQVLVVKQAERHTPNAVDVASGLNIAAFNVGIALGSVVGGFVVEHLGLMHTPWIGALIVLLAYGLTHVSEAGERRAALA